MKYPLNKPRQAGAISIAFERLHEILDLPDSVEIFGARMDENEVVQIFIRGPGMPDWPYLTEVSEVEAVYESREPPERPYGLVSLAGLTPEQLEKEAQVEDDPLASDDPSTGSQAGA